MAAIAVVSDNVAPQMAAIQATIDAANADLAEALDLLADLQVSGIDGDKVTLTAIAGLTALEAQAAFAELKESIDDVVDTNIPAAVAPKLNISDKASQAEAEAGTDDTKYMTALRTADAIAAQSGDAVIETVTSGGTFSKEDDDFGYLIELWGGGGGGSNATTASTTFGGGGGEYISKFVAASSISATEAVVIGAGGLGDTNGLTSGGTNGGTTSFGSILSARGGFAGSASLNNGAGGAGQIPISGKGLGGYSSGSGGAGVTTTANAGGSSTMGGAGGGSTNNATGVAAGGVSGSGGNGGTGNATAGVKGGNGSPRGGGGGGSSNNGGGGDGGRGEARIVRFKRIKQ